MPRFYSGNLCEEDPEKHEEIHKAVTEMLKGQHLDELSQEIHFKIESDGFIVTQKPNGYWTITIHGHRPEVHE